jgi:hypothetical protein
VHRVRSESSGLPTQLGEERLDLAVEAGVVDGDEK